MGVQNLCRSLPFYINVVIRQITRSTRPGKVVTKKLRSSYPSRKWFRHWLLSWTSTVVCRVKLRWDPVPLTLLRVLEQLCNSVHHKRSVLSGLGFDPQKYSLALGPHEGRRWFYAVFVQYTRLHSCTHQGCLQFKSWDRRRSFRSATSLTTYEAHLRRVWSDDTPIGHRCRCFPTGIREYVQLESQCID